MYWVDFQDLHKVVKQNWIFLKTYDIKELLLNTQKYMSYF